MKKLMILLSMLTILGLLAACGGNADAASNTNQQESAPASDTTQDGTLAGGFEVPLQTTLIVGSFELEGTENEITAEQAAELLPLWMVLKNLLESDTAAVEEVNALTNQINNAMTDAQIDQISSMEQTGQSMRMLMEELGLNQSFQRPETTEGEEGSQRGANRPEGMPSGVGPGGGQGTEGLTPEQIESMQATREAGGGGAGRGMGVMVNTDLINALIELLQSK